MRIVKDKLAESMSQDRGWLSSAYYNRFAQEAILGGNISDETPAASVTVEVLNQIIMGYEGYLTLDFARQFHTDKASLIIPRGTYGSATEISSGGFTNSPKSTSPLTIAIDKEYGTEVTYTRAHLEDASWDVLAEQNEGAGYAIKSKLVQLCVDAMQAVSASYTGAAVDLGTWADVVDFVAVPDVSGYGPVDYCLCTVSGYWDLFTNQQFISSLYVSTEDAIKTGIAKTTLGVNFVRCEHADFPIVVNSKKAVALAFRRDLKVEPFEHPEDNEYGFIASVRAKVGLINNGAFAVGGVYGI